VVVCILFDLPAVLRAGETAKTHFVIS